MSKAKLQEVEELHNLVAKQLKKNLDDTKVLAQAITFLKNNNITVDLQESKDMQDIFTSINKLVDKTKVTNNNNKDTIELLLSDIA